MQLVIDLADWPYFLCAASGIVSTAYLFYRFTTWLQDCWQARVDRVEAAARATARIAAKVSEELDDYISTLELQNEGLRHQVADLIAEQLGFNDERKRLAKRINILAEEMDLTDSSKRTQVIPNLSNE
jgi:hypothetical protein